MGAEDNIEPLMTTFDRAVTHFTRRPDYDSLMQLNAASMAAWNAIHDEVATDLVTAAACAQGFGDVCAMALPMFAKFEMPPEKKLAEECRGAIANFKLRHGFAATLAEKGPVTMKQKMRKTHERLSEKIRGG